MFKIGEFSKLTRVSVRMLRHYDELGLLRPTEINTLTGYRMYSADQIPDMNRIAVLKEMGFTLAEITGLLDTEFSAGSLMVLLENRKRGILEAIREEREKLLRVEALMRRIKKEEAVLKYEISVKSIPAYRVLSLREVIPEYSAEGRLWNELQAYASAQRLKCSPPSYAIYHDPGYKEQDVDVEVTFGVTGNAEETDRIKLRELDAVPEMAVVFHRGPFEEMSSAYHALGVWLSDNRYMISGETRAIYHKGPWTESDPAEYLTEIQIPVTKESE